MALSPPYRARIATEDVSAFDAGEATPPRSYLLAARLFAGGLSGSALILLLVISSFAVEFGALGLLPRCHASHEISSARQLRKTAPTVVARSGHKPFARQGLAAVRAQGRRARPAPATQRNTSEPPTTETKANAVSAAHATRGDSPQPSTASSAQEPAPQADEPVQLRRPRPRRHPGVVRSGSTHPARATGSTCTGSRCHHRDDWWERRERPAGRTGDSGARLREAYAATLYRRQTERSFATA